jgi:hypothetical protein
MRRCDQVFSVYKVIGVYRGQEGGSKGTVDPSRIFSQLSSSSFRRTLFQHSFRLLQHHLSLFRSHSLPLSFTPSIPCFCLVHTHSSKLVVEFSKSFQSLLFPKFVYTFIRSSQRIDLHFHSTFHNCISHRQIASVTNRNYQFSFSQLLRSMPPMRRLEVCIRLQCVSFAERNRRC